jgi:hypothetical protein
MKKILLLASLLSVVSFYGFSQMHLTLSDSSGAVANDATITVAALPSSLSLDTYMFITNNTSDSLPVKVKKVEVSKIHGTDNYFCWYSCFGSGVYESPTPIYVHSMETNHFDFSGHYSPNDSVGITIIRYVFFVANNPLDSVCYNVKFDTRIQGVSNASGKKDFSLTAFPNPSNSFTNVDYAYPDGTSATLVIRNLLGVVVNQSSLPQASGRMNISTTGLSNGVYFISLVENGQPVVTKKLTVQH